MLLVVCSLTILCALRVSNEEIRPSYTEGDLFREINDGLEYFDQLIADLEWRSSVNASDEFIELKSIAVESKNSWKNRWCEILKNLANTHLWTVDLLAKHLCSGPRYSTKLVRQIMTVSDGLKVSYARATICKDAEDGSECYHGEREVSKLMSTSRNEADLLWAWTSWRDELSRTKPLFKILVDLQNMAARRNGYSDMGEYWREEFDIPKLEDYFERIYREIRPLYLLLHAVVRFRLNKIYPETVDLRKPIPAHLLGNMWGQNWDTLIDLLLPETLASVPNLTEFMRGKNYTVNTMVRDAEEFFVSMGFPSLTRSFWENSIFERKNGTDASCHASAANMYRKDDFRILACLEVSEEDLNVVYHELGHIQYYMAYQNQPAMYKNGINSAFHESIGDAIFYGAMTIPHLKRLNLIDDSVDHKFLETVLLLKFALRKLPHIPSALIVEKWRWSVFGGKIKFSDYNKSWWHLHRLYMGIAPPSFRSGDFFDPAAKYHVVQNIPYSRYFLADVLQVQLFEGMCEAATKERLGKNFLEFSLRNCDVQGSKMAGNVLRSLMEPGSSVDRKLALKMATGSPDYRVEPFLRLFAPVREFLEREVRRNDIPVGWEDD